MIDRVDLFTITNHLFHLFLDENDIIIIKDIISQKNFKNIEKLDILYIITLPARPINVEYNDEELQIRCNKIIDQLIEISKFNYSNDEIEILKKYYFYLYKKINKDDVGTNINNLEHLITNEIDNLIPLVKYINEELRLILLENYQYSDNIYEQKIDSIETHLRIAQSTKKFRLEIASILRE